MIKATETSEKQRENRALFLHELKMFMNQKLFEKNLITEEMFRTAKELLLKQNR